MTSGRRNLHPGSQLLERHLDRIRSSRLLVMGSPRDSFPLLLHQRLPQTRIIAFEHDYAAYRYLRDLFLAAGLDPESVRFGPWYTPDEELHDAAIVFLPKSHGLLALTLSMAAAAVRAGTPVYLVGESKAGIRSSRTVLEQQVGSIEASDAARHCVLYRAVRSGDPPAAAGLDAWAETYTVEVWGITLKVVSFPGVFSHGRLDEGTRFFLEQLEAPPSTGRALDFGCGAGVIGAAVKQRWPDYHADMVDTSALALEAARRTMEANGLSAGSISASNVYSDVDARYAWILSNPPFHVGIRRDYDLSVAEEFFRETPRHLEPDGRLSIVSNSFLKYQPLIEQHVGHCRVTADNGRYRVYEGSQTDRGAR